MLQSPLQPQAPARTPGAHEPGEFTRMPNTPPQGLAGEQAAPPSPQPHSGGNATRAFPALSPAPAEASGPSEFTKMFKAPPASAAPEAVKKRARPPLPKVKKRNNLPTILMIVAVVLMLVVLYLAFK